MTKTKWIYFLLLAMLCGARMTHAEKTAFQEQCTISEEASYLKPVEISLSRDAQKRLIATIETEDLLLKSLTWAEYEDYVRLFTDPIAMEKYGDEPFTEEEVKEIMEIWIDRWQKDEDFFSAFAIYLKKEDRPFIGHIILGHGEHSGEAELAYIIKPSHQHQGYGKQAVTAIVYGYAPWLIEHGARANMHTWRSAPLRFIHATVRLDNVASIRILERMGMTKGVIEMLWGKERVHYSITTEELMKNFKILKNS
jgi:RimJ/RimL family protein N-acetyltransferase